MKKKYMLLLLLIFGFIQELTAQQTSLTAAEKTGMLFMREEEKLARDVYDSLYEKWQINPFGNIRMSERQHMQRMKDLLEIYQLPDPVEKNNDRPGLFENATLQNYYKELVNKGSKSVTEALKAGAYIEELDIRDLKEQVAATTKPDIVRVYEYLIMASENHLRAFVRRLGNSGITYQPVLLGKEDFKKIIDQ